MWPALALYYCIMNYLFQDINSDARLIDNRSQELLSMVAYVKIDDWVLIIYQNIKTTSCQQVRNRALLTGVTVCDNF